MASRGRKFADDGWAIWIDGDDTSTVYINDWINPAGRSFVDIGIRIRGVRVTQNLYLYIPFPVLHEEVEDVSLQLHDQDILCAMFSSMCLVDYEKNRCTSEIAYNGKTVDIIHISRAGFTVEPLASGSLLTLALDRLLEYLDNDEAYLLMRLPHRSLDEIFKPRITVGSSLTRLRDLVTSPVVSQRCGYSVRINEARMLPPEINRIGAFHRQKLKKAVVSLSVNEDYSLNDGGCYRIRRLEENLYRNFVPGDFSCEDVITYQWNRTRDDDLRGHFNFYFDISRETISKSSMLVYMILLLLIGVSGGALWDLIKFIF